MTTHRIHELIDSTLATLAPGRVQVAFSGGLDSTVLLHALAQLSSARERGLRAIHINHGLHGDSANWSRHCMDVAASLGVELTIHAVDVSREPGFGLEANARRARHGAIEAQLSLGDIVAFAHHRSDQAETVLLKLLRGAGPEGLGAMRPLRPFGPGFAWRPLLAVPHAALRDYANQFGLLWVDDPSNADPTPDRNYLRQQVFPLLARRWPEAEASMAQSAVWSRDAADFIESESERALARLQGLDPFTLRHGEWLALHGALRDPVLRRWLRSLGLPEPTHFQVSELVRQLEEAGEDRQPCVRWPGIELRRYRDLLHALRPLHFPTGDWKASFDGAPLELPSDLGALRLVGDTGETVRLASTLAVRFRQGGESLRLAASGPKRELRDLLQDAGIPPWQRSRLPLLLDGSGHVVAVADLWLSDVGHALFDPLAARIEWTHGRPA